LRDFVLVGQRPVPVVIGAAVAVFSADARVSRHNGPTIPVIDRNNSAVDEAAGSRPTN
jgi:hypothetical protein